MIAFNSLSALPLILSGLLASSPDNVTSASQGNDAGREAVRQAQSEEQTGTDTSRDIIHPIQRSLVFSYDGCGNRTTMEYDDGIGIIPLPLGNENTENNNTEEGGE